MEERIRALRPEDLEALTEMWNGTDSIWPGGLTSGMPLTLDRMTQWVESTEYLTPFVAIHEGRIVGFCGLTPDQGEADVAYIGIIGVVPEVLNLGFGRDLLRHAVARASSLGYRRLDLDTWSANRRAIPLYKRTGFFWVPQTSVKMQNFLPSLLRDDRVLLFLGDADWYHCLRPTITLDEDTFAEGGLPCFPYVFEKDGQRLHLTLESGTGGLLAYDDDRLSLGLVVPHPRLVVGEPELAQLRVSRKGKLDRSVPLTVFGEGSGGIKANRVVASQIEQSASFEIELAATRPVKNLHSLPVASQPALRVQASVDGEAFSLTAGVPADPALEVVAEPSLLSLAPGRPGRLWLGVKNNSRGALAARLQLTTCGDFAIRPLAGLEFQLSPGETASAEVEVVAPEGQHSLRIVPVIAGDRQGRPVEAGMREIPVVAGGPSQVYAYRVEDGAVVENAHLRAIVSARAGSIRLQTKNPSQDLVEQRATIGPPFMPSEFAGREFDVQTDAREGRASIYLAIESTRRPGLWFRSTITLTASPRVESEYSLVNLSDRAYRAEVRVEHTMRLHSSLVAIPLAEGLLVDSAEAADWEGGARFAECYAETWAALQREDLTVGFLWPEGSGPEFSRRYGPVFTLPGVTVSPGETVDAGRLVLFGGTGGWRTVRDQWRRLFNPGAPEQPEDPVRAAQPRLFPHAVVYAGEPVPVELYVRHLRGRALSGRVDLAMPEGWSATQRAWAVDALRRGRVRRFDTVVALRDTSKGSAFPAADQATLVLDANLAVGRQQVALLSLGRPGGEVRISESTPSSGRVLLVENGWGSFAVSPEHAASVVSFEHAGVNHLLSTYPTPGELMWQRPFFGGIAPVVAPGGAHFHPIHAGRLHDERFDVEYPVQRSHWGAVWTGLRLTSALKRPAGIRLDVEYFTYGGSNLLLAAVRLTNTTGTPLGVQTFLGCYLQVAGETRGTVLRYLAEGEHNTRREEFDVWLAPSSDWAAVESERTGLTAALVSVTDSFHIQAYSLGLEGAHLFNVGDTLLAPGASAEYLSLFVLAESATKARLYRALGWSGQIGVPPEH